MKLDKVVKSGGFPPEKMLATVEVPPPARLVDMCSREQRVEGARSTGATGASSGSPDGRRVVSGVPANALRLWNPEMFTQMEYPREGHSN